MADLQHQCNGVRRRGETRLGKSTRTTTPVASPDVLERATSTPPADALTGDRTVGKGDTQPPKSKRAATPGKIDEEVHALALQAWCRRQLGKPLLKRHEKAVELCKKASRHRRYQITPESRGPGPARPRLRQSPPQRSRLCWPSIARCPPWATLALTRSPRAWSIASKSLSSLTATSAKWPTSW